MASSPSRKRSDGVDKTGHEGTIRKQSEAVYCQVSGPIGRLRNQVKTREGEKETSIFGSLGVLFDACVRVISKLNQARSLGLARLEGAHHHHDGQTDGRATMVMQQHGRLDDTHPDDQPRYDVRR